MYLHLCYSVINTDTALGLDILFFFFSSTSTKIHTVYSLSTFSFTNCQEFSWPLGTDTIPIKPTRDLTRGVRQGQGLGWELQRKLCTAEGVEAEHRLTALHSQSGATGLQEQSQYLQLQSRPDADLNPFRSQSDTRKKMFHSLSIKRLIGDVKASGVTEC